MDITSAMDFFDNPKWNQYRDFVNDYKEFLTKYYAKHPDKSIEQAIDFFVELMTALSFEQERADFVEREMK